MPLHSAAGTVLAGFSVLVPAARGPVLEEERTLALMRAARDDMDDEIRAANFGLKA